MAQRAHSKDVADDLRAAASDLGPKVADAIDRVETHVKAGDTAGVATELKGAAGEVKSAVVEQGRQLYETAKTTATSFADERKDAAAQSVAGLAASLRDSGKGFGERPNIQAFVGSAADGLDQLASGLRERSFAEIYADVEDYARRSPATVGAVAVVAGFFLARFIKSSADELSEKGAQSRAAAASRTRRRSPAELDV